jgi:hypothetical protein
LHSGHKNIRKRKRNCKFQKKKKTEISFAKFTKAQKWEGKFSEFLFLKNLWFQSTKVRKKYF